MSDHPDHSTGSRWAASGGPFGPQGTSSGDGRGVLVFVALFASALVILGIGVFLLMRDSTSGDAAEAGTAPPAVPSTDPAVEAPPADTAAPADVAAVTAVPVASAPVEVVDLLTGDRVAGIVDEIAVVRGADPVRMLSTAIYPEYLFAEVQDPAIPANIDRYEWRGQVGASTPVNPAGDAPVETRLYSADNVNWSAIAAIVASAPAAVAVEAGVVTHVIVERALPFSEDVRMRVFVTGPRGDGFVDADANGTIVSVNGS